MTLLYDHVMAHDRCGSGLPPRALSCFAPAQFRETLAELVRQERWSLAEALGDAGLSLYPQSEDILSMTALLCAVQGDWSQAERRLRELLGLQGQHSSAFTWRLLVRCLRCQLEHLPALEAAKEGLVFHPADTELLAEQAALSNWLAQGAGHPAASAVQ